MDRLDRVIQEQKTHIFQYDLDGRVKSGHDIKCFREEIARTFALLRRTRFCTVALLKDDADMQRSFVLHALKI